MSGHTTLRPSENDFDWLGKGTYFWEYGPQRALQWAEEASKRKPDAIQRPAILGAIIHLGNCFDLLDTRFTEFLAGSFFEFRTAMSGEGRSLPANSLRRHGEAQPFIRRLDCAVINWAIELWEQARGNRVDTVRGMFQEGELVFPGSAIHRKSHIQIAVRRSDAVVGFFRPVPLHIL